MDEAPPEFLRRLGAVLDSLQQDLRGPHYTLVVEADLQRVQLRDARFHVPRADVDHWNRFGTLRTSLVRDLAYHAKRAALARAGVGDRAALEADALTYAEVFLRSGYFEAGEP